MTHKNPFKYFIGYNDNDVIRPLCIKNLKVIQQCPLRLTTNNCSKSTIKYGKELKSYRKYNLAADPFMVMTINM